MASKVIKVAAEAAREELDHPRNLLRLAELASLSAASARGQVFAGRASSPACAFRR
jgi:hypothetical protein